MFCKYCGAQISVDSLFCSNCGKNIKSEGKNQSISETGNIDFSDTWYYQDDFHEGGPFTFDEMVSKIKKREIDYDGAVKTNKESDDWIPLVESVFASVIENVPPRQISISDKWIWCLAILPMLITMIFHNVAVLSPLSNYDWIICIVLNGLFIILDKKDIEDAGFFESWSYLGIIIVPLYLIIREIKTNHNYAPAIINAFLLAVDLFIL